MERGTAHPPPPGGIDWGGKDVAQVPDFSELLHSEQAGKLMHDKTAVETIQKAPQTQKLLSMLSQSVGGDLEGAADAAAKGDAAKLMGAMTKLLNDPEGKRLVEEISRTIQK